MQFTKKKNILTWNVAPLWTMSWDIGLLINSNKGIAISSMLYGSSDSETLGLIFSCFGSRRSRWQDHQNKNKINLLSTNIHLTKMLNYPSKQVFPHPNSQVFPRPYIQCTHSTSLRAYSHWHFSYWRYIWMYEKSSSDLHWELICTKHTINGISEYCDYRRSIFRQFLHQAIIIMSADQMALCCAVSKPWLRLRSQVIHFKT